MAEKNDSPSCLGMIAGMAVLFALCKLMDFVFSLQIVQTAVGYILGGLIGIALLFYAVYVPVMLFGSIRSRRSHDYPVRCRLVEGSDSPGPPEEQEGLPVYLLLTVSEYHLELAALQTSRAWSIIPADNPSRFNLISRGHPTPIRLPRGAISLSYSSARRAGETTGTLPGEQEDGQIQIVLAFSAVGGPRFSDAESIGELPVRLAMEVVRRGGQEDWEATRELYQRLQRFLKNPEPYDEEEDDSWMYRSRPMYW